MEAKYKLAIDDKGRRFWRCWLDGAESNPAPLGAPLLFPCKDQQADPSDPESHTVRYPLGTTVHITTPDKEAAGTKTFAPVEPDSPFSLRQIAFEFVKNKLTR